MMSIKKIGIILAALIGLADPAHAQQGIDQQFITRCVPQTLQVTDYITVVRAGSSCNAQYTSSSLPIATLSTNGIVHPDGTTLTVNAAGVISRIGPPDSTVIGSVTSASPYISSNVTSGFYTPATNTIGVELNAIKAMQWNTLSAGVDYLTVTPGKSGTAPKITVAGSTANQGLNLSAIGSGSLTLNGSLVVSSGGVMTSATWNGSTIGTAYGGTGVVSPAAHSVLLGNGSSAMTALAVSASSGWVLTGNGASSDPSWQAPPAGLTGTTTVAQRMVQSTAIAGTTTYSTAVWPLTTTANQVLYSNATNSVTGMAVCTSGVFATNASQTPLCNTHIGISSTGQVSMDQSLAVTSTGRVAGGLLGTTTGDNGCTGCIGEYLSSTTTPGSQVSLTSGAPSNVTSLSLTAGDWDVRGIVDYNPNGATVTSIYYAALNATASTLPTAPADGGMSLYNTTATAGATAYMPITPTRFSLSGTTTIYLIGQSSFTINTNAAYGFIGARRIR